MLGVAVPAWTVHPTGAAMAVRGAAKKRPSDVRESAKALRSDVGLGPHRRGVKRFIVSSFLGMRECSPGSRSKRHGRKTTMRFPAPALNNFVTVPKDRSKGIDVVGLISLDRAVVERKPARAVVQRHR